jgi:hypothetical protein
MSNCPTCKESILSQTPSLIGQTQCTQTCPPDITCVDIIPSNCVFYSGPTLSCPSGNTSVNYGVTITSALNTMYQLLCQNSTSCTAKITAGDTCCGYLFDKFSSSSLSITTVTNEAGCQTLNIEETCYTWTELKKGNPGLINGWTYASLPFEKPAISNVKNCIVRLAGTITSGAATPLVFGANQVAILPVGKRPDRVRRFTVNVASTTSVIPALLAINSNGEVSLILTSVPSSKVTLSFDGISFETGTIII